MGNEKRKAKRKSLRNELMNSFFKSSLATVIFYSVYYFKFSTTEYPTILEKIIDVYYYNVISDIIAIFVIYMLFKARKVKMDYERVNKRYLDSNAFLRLLVESLFVALIISFSLNSYANLNILEFLLRYFIVSFTVKITVSVVSSYINKRNKRSPIIVVMLIFCILIILKVTI